MEPDPSRPTRTRAAAAKIRRPDRRHAVAALLLVTALALLALVALPALAQGDAAGERHQPSEIQRDPDVPALPFADNPDPELCGIPQPVLEADSAATITGMYDGELVMDPVLLYDSHLRRSVVGSVPSGHPITLQLFQSNPELNYFQIRAVVDGESVQGWVPAPFVVREDVAGGGAGG